MIVVSLKPVKAVTGVRLRNPPDSLPLVSWKVCNLRSGDSESYQPVSSAALHSRVSGLTLSSCPHSRFLLLHEAVLCTSPR